MNPGADEDKAVTASYDTMFNRAVISGQRELAATGKEWKVVAGSVVLSKQVTLYGTRPCLT